MTTTQPRNEALETLLEFLKANRNFDFTGYKRASLQRRIDKRMRDVGIEDYAAYLEHLQADPGEFASLFDTVLINVTAFFRDDAPWQVLADTVLPELLARKPADSAIRVWSAGCASGEEAYTLAMVLAELMGENDFRARVKIYATDVDDSALATARRAVYSAKAAEPVPPPLREKYFETVNGDYAFRKDLRRSVIFGRNDLVRDAPISRIDLLVCRNALMYFNAETQERILNRFHFALTNEGILFLGRAETLLTHSSLFTAIDPQRRLFMRAARPVYNDRRALVEALVAENGSRNVTPQLRLREAAYNATPVAQIVLDRNGFLVLANERARNLFGIVPADIGRPLQDLQLSYRPVELRAAIDQTYGENGTIYIREVPWHVGDERWFDVAVTPLGGPSQSPAGVSVTFTDITPIKQLRRELERSHGLLEVSSEEMQSTNEEMETTNEELQSTIEELETTNEELHSTNEELETMNAELHATNEELHSVDSEAKQRSDELNQLNAFLESVFSSLSGAIVVVDPEFKVLVWNPRAEEFWGLRSSEVEGSHFLNLDIGLPVTMLRPLIKSTLAGEPSVQTMDVDGRNRRGQSIRCHVSCTQLRTPGEDFARGVILQIEVTPVPQ